MLLPVVALGNLIRIEDSTLVVSWHTRLGRYTIPILKPEEVPGEIKLSADSVLRGHDQSMGAARKDRNSLLQERRRDRDWLSCPARLSRAASGHRSYSRVVGTKRLG